MSSMSSEPLQFLMLHMSAGTSGVHVNEEEGQALDGLLGFISELWEKAPAKIADQLLNMDGTKARTAAHGLQGSVEELLHKLERFKIRTYDLGGVVKEEDKR
ncbi:hypothetical protein Pyn_21673 [Prunus yedoensis var. nudiflora]|uniref:Uncharacterized protein n=1 Tax=Prunus yedoensis var. nudiflora TaxID=2094558 RepID=A0A314Y1L5_PRUYE|nr:hypothetical protein Pyn_21673 [Prunus yedoensis var. nudiflora]